MAPLAMQLVIADFSLFQNIIRKFKTPTRPKALQCEVCFL